MPPIRVHVGDDEVLLDDSLRYVERAVAAQDLIWEQYSYLVDLQTLLAGNSPTVIFNAMPVSQLTPPQEPREDVLINKTGSTNGFGAYVAFVPEMKMGIIILANKSYPIDDRVTMAHQILTKLGNRDGA